MNPGGEPSSWKVKLYANIGVSELFVHRLVMEIPKLLDASMIFDPQRAEAREEIGTLLKDGFMPAFEHLRKIRAHAVDRPPELNRRQAYEDFMSTLWRAHKTLLPNATRLMGFEIGFLYQAQPKFEKGLAKFLVSNPRVVKPFGDYLRQQRATWQSKIASIRNDFIEHRTLDWNDVRLFYRVERAEMFFESAWKTAFDILAVLIVSKFPPMCGIEEVPPSERNPASPDRFRFVLYKRLPDPQAG